MERVLVTGSGGTIGRRLVQELRDRHGIDSVMGVGKRHSDDPHYVRADVAEQRQLARAFELHRPTIVYHLAAEFGRNNGEEYYETLWRTNVVGTRNVLDQCWEWQSKLVFASSSEVYGEGFDGKSPLREDMLETAQPRHSNEYAISKYTNELQIQNAISRHGIQVATLRFFNAYGPGEEYHPYRSVVALFVYRALKGIPFEIYENYWRTFMHIDNFVPTLANVAERFTPGITNIGGTDFRKVSDMADLVIQHTRCDPSLAVLLPEEKHNVVSKRPDIERARVLFGHNPTTTLESGIPETVTWARSRYSTGT